MNLKYKNWIDKNVKNPKGNCREITKQMVLIFPKLKRVRGFYYDLLLQKKFEHWWLIDKNNEIVDPTRKQFLGYGEYILWNEGDLEPTRNCLECGEYVYDAEYFCEKCIKMKKSKYIKKGDL